MSAELTGYAIWYPRCDNSYEAVDAEPVTPLPFRMLIEMRLGGTGFAPPGLRPERTAAGVPGGRTGGCLKVPHRRLDRRRRRGQLVRPLQVADLRLEEVP